MIPISSFANKKIAVLGLARSGMASAQSLIAGGAHVWAWDDDAQNRERAAAEKIPVIDLSSADWREMAALVLSPGIPHTLPSPHPVAVAAKNAGVPIISDVYLLIKNMPGANFVGITGTNGKSTTTSLIAHIIGGAGKPVAAGGNLGQAALTLKPLGADGCYVLELSSYQLELIPDCRINVGVFLNLTPDHLERHGDMDGYLNAKKNMFLHQQKSDIAIIGVDDEWGKKLHTELSAAKKQKIIPVSVGTKLERGVYVLDGILYDTTSQRIEKIMDLRDAKSLPGDHNWQNAAAAYAAAKSLNVPRGTICNLIADFPGLAHRQEKVASVGNITFINDSKATNPEAAAKALSCYRPIYWIAGGKPKGEDLDACAPFYGNIQHAFLIGQAADMFARILEPHMPYKISGDLQTAVADAFAQAKRDGMNDPVVLLSPACASFDQFRDFEHRGDEFRKFVSELGSGERKIAS